MLPTGNTEQAQSMCPIGMRSKPYAQFRVSEEKTWKPPRQIEHG
jgi:hypothetical protein